MSKKQISAAEHIYNIARSNPEELITLNLNTPHLDINAKDDIGFTALHIAVEHEDLGALKALIANGANIDATSKDKDTPLDCALNLNIKNPNIAAFLVKNGAHISTFTELSQQKLKEYKALDNSPEDIAQKAQQLVKGLEDHQGHIRSIDGRSPMSPKGFVRRNDEKHRVRRLSIPNMPGH